MRCVLCLSECDDRWPTRTEYLCEPCAAGLRLAGLDRDAATVLGAEK